MKCSRCNIERGPEFCYAPPVHRAMPVGVRIDDKRSTIRDRRTRSLRQAVHFLVWFARVLNNILSIPRIIFFSQNFM